MPAVKSAPSWFKFETWTSITLIYFWHKLLRKVGMPVVGAVDGP
jgi:hypothetical protein